MNISFSSKNITIEGNIKSVGDYQSIKSALEKVTAQHKSITVTIVDSISITSSVIGYLNKLVLKDKIDMQVLVGTDQLLELFEDLSLSSTFKVKKL